MAVHLDPASLFSPSRLSPLSSIESSTPSSRPQLMPTRRKVECYVALPVLSPSVKELYEPTPDYLGGDPEFVRSDLDAIVGEFPLDDRARPSHYFVRFKDGLARRISSRTFLAQYTDLVDEYQHRKAQGLLDHFDPASEEVHEYSRMTARLSADAPSCTVTPETPSESDASQSNHSSFSEAGDDISDDEDYGAQVSFRKSTCVAAGDKKPKQSKLPFSPKKLRGDRLWRKNTVPDSEDDLGGYSQVNTNVPPPARRSTRTRKNVFVNLVDDEESDGDSHYDSPGYGDTVREAGKKNKTKRPATARPAYGRFRHVDGLDIDFFGDKATSSLRAHRDICEKCHKRPTHEELKIFKKGRRRSKPAEGESDGDEDHIQSLGGWVRCLKCPVAAHWKCLAKTQRDEITRAACARDKDLLKLQEQDANEQSASSLPDRKELDVNQTTEFICGPCMKGGICMGCLEVALEPDPSLANKHSSDNSSLEPTQSDVPRIEMEDDTSCPINAASMQPSQELLFRCFSCKRLAHYRHLPTPENAQWTDAVLASHYQEETGWRCADCASYVYQLDKILAWRPYPPEAVEPTLTSSPDPKASLPREYLVKWADRSYRRTQWVPHLWLVSTSFLKLKHFLAKGSKVPLLGEPISDKVAMDVGTIDKEPIGFEPSTDNSLETAPPTAPKDVFLGPLPDAEQRIPPAWKTIDRVLDVRFWKPSSSANDKRKNKRIVHRDQANGLHLDPNQQLQRAYVEGEQPDESLLEDLDGWLSRTDQVLPVDSIDEIVWVFVKWEDLGYDDATWDSPPRRGEPAYDAYERAFQYFVDSLKVQAKKTRKEIKRIEDRVENGYGDFALKRDSDEQPNLGQSDHLRLMKFQIDGYNWLCDNWWNRQPSILADEMGLGKTVQIVTFLGTVIEQFSAAPALVVVPNSTITNWVREFSRWAPRLRVVPFFGEAKSRDVVMRYELFHRAKREPKYHVLVTTYETVTNPRDFTTAFKSIDRWEILVVDEGQRLKSDNSLLFKKLNELRPIHRIIMTGTPLNNNIRELFNLMNFLDHDKWQDLEALEEEYEELSEELVRQLHSRLKPYFLRRIKSEVLQLPPKNEVIVPLSLTPLQKEIYRSILSLNLDVLRHFTQVSSVGAGRTAISKTNLNNILMQLRKCIQHPYLISNDIEPRNLEPREAHEKLIDASAKLRLLKLLLPKLKARKHRVLLFSQFTIALDIIEDFLRGEDYKYLRLDGNTKQAVRQKGMDEFNKPDSEYFIYLLTTRAGGVGINLYTADTVIIYDPDFNPHQDLQAIARSHRYGQQKTCLVFKLMVKDSAEERIMLMGKKKLVLDHLIVQKMDDDENGGDDVKSILTFGARALFEETDQSSKDIAYTDHDLDRLIEKTEIEGEENNITNEPGLKFSFAKVWTAEKDTLEDIGDPVPDLDQGDSWAQALERIAARKDIAKEKEATGRGVRRKAAAAFPQQQLDFLEALDDAPAKGKGKSRKKGRPKSGTSSDSDDVYDGSAHRGTGDDTDSTTELMDVDQGLSLTPVSPRPQPRYLFTSSPNKQPPPYRDHQKCGLCGCGHGPGACSMMGSSSNLMEYREILLNHTNDEPWESRKAAIEAIDQTLHARGQGHLLAGQPLKLVSQPGSSSAFMDASDSSSRGKDTKNHHQSTPRQMFTQRIRPEVAAHESNRMSIHQDRGHYVAGRSTDSSLPVALPHKRLPSPNGVLGNPSKKQRQNDSPRCPVCSGPRHPLDTCPALQQDIQSIVKHILRLSEDPLQKQVIEELRRLLKQRKRENEEAGQSRHMTMQMLS